MAKEKKKAGKETIYTELRNVFFSGLDELDKLDAERIKQVIYEHYQEIEREIQKPVKLKLHFKKYQHGGRDKYSVQLMVDFPGKPITAEHIYDPARWDVVAIVHKLLKKAKKEIAHKFKTETSYRKPYY